MNHAERLIPNSEELVSKAFDGEVIIINLVTGAYYSTTGSGAVIWDAIECGASRDGVVARMENTFDGDGAAMAADVDRWLAELTAENLIRVSADTASPIADAAGSATSPRQPYVPPVLSAYRDMRDLLALDPPMPVLGEASQEWKPASAE
jgi:hypothetical protein